MNDVLRIPSLSSNVVEFVKEATNFFPDKEMLKLLNTLLPIAQCFLFARHTQLYIDLTQSSSAEDLETGRNSDGGGKIVSSGSWLDQLSRLRVFRAEKVLVEHRLIDFASIIDVEKDSEDQSTQEKEKEEEEKEKDGAVVESLEKAFWGDDARFWIQRESDDPSLNCSHGTW